MSNKPLIVGNYETRFLCNVYKSVTLIQLTYTVSACVPVLFISVFSKCGCSVQRKTVIKQIKMQGKDTKIIPFAVYSLKLSW